MPAPNKINLRCPINCGAAKFFKQMKTADYKRQWALQLNYLVYLFWYMLGELPERATDAGREEAIDDWIGRRVERSQTLDEGGHRRGGLRPRHLQLRRYHRLNTIMA
jgi:hypothetical protein